MILDDIADNTRKKLTSIDNLQRDSMKEMAYTLSPSNTFPFFRALSKPGISFIAEVKKASPSKGLISKDFNPVKTAREYEEIGIDAISVLTETDYFLGSPDYLKAISKEVSTPLLRKDFIIDSYQIHEAKVIGASAVLLICALLDKKTLELFYGEATKLGLDVLCEAHNREEVEMALEIDARIIGINNRDLKTFNVDFSNSERMRKFIPECKIMVSESGYSKREDIIRAQDMNVDAVLIGESFMRSSSKKELLSSLKGQSI